MKGLTWHHLVLLTILVIVGYYGFINFSNRYEAKNWDQPLLVTIYPLNDGGDPEIQPFVDEVTTEQFQPAVNFLQAQASRYNIATTPLIKLQMGTTISQEAPPQPPPAESNMLSNLMWSFKLRYWAYKEAYHHRDKTNISVFLLYKQHKPGQLPQDSIALRNGMLAVVNAFANPEFQEINNLLFAHELLHTVGAIDKYNEKLQPIFPDGFAYPNNNPPYPQQFCEIMALYIPITAERAELARNLSQCVVGPQTASEIGWW